MENCTLTPVRDRLALILGQLEQRITEGPDSPATSGIRSWVQTLTGNGTADADRLIQSIHADPALTGHVLRIANAPVYRPRLPVASLEQAVARLGVGPISEIALAVSIEAEFYQAPGHEVQASYLWHHALAGGLWGREIARERDHDPDTAFVCGLLHHIGKPVVLRELIRLGSDRNADSWIREESPGLIRAHHAQAGVCVAEALAFPRVVHEVIQYTEQYEAAPTFRDECLITHAANRLADHLLDPERVREEAVFDLPAMHDLDFHSSDLKRLLARSPAVWNTMEEVIP